MPKVRTFYYQSRNQALISIKCSRADYFKSSFISHGGHTLQGSSIYVIKDPTLDIKIKHSRLTILPTKVPISGKKKKIVSLQSEECRMTKFKRKNARKNKNPTWTLPSSRLIFSVLCSIRPFNINFKETVQLILSFKGTVQHILSFKGNQWYKPSETKRGKIIFK